MLQHYLSKLTIIVNTTFVYYICGNLNIRVYNYCSSYIIDKMARERVPRQRAQSVDYGLDDSSSLALHLKDVQKFHGIGRGANHVLNAFTMKVPYGTM